MEEGDLASIVETLRKIRGKPVHSAAPKIRGDLRKQPAGKRDQDDSRADAAHPERLDPPPDETALHVLLVEDESAVALSLKRQLEAEGIHVDIAEDGETGLAMARRQSYDAILIDRRLPKMSGDRVLEQLREDGDRTPVLMLTGYPNVDSAFRAGRLHAADYLVKGSLTSVQLAAAVRRAAATNPRAAAERSLFSAPTVETSPRIRDLRSCLARFDTSPTPDAEHGDGWRRTLARVLVRAAVGRTLTFLEFQACARALKRLHSSEGPPSATTAQRIGEWFTDVVRRSAAPPHVRALAVVARIEAAGANRPDLSEHQIAREQNVTIADTTRWLHEYAGLPFQECRRLVVMREVLLLLTETTDQVKRIAFTVGYRHESRLDHECGATFGLTPTDLRLLSRVGGDGRQR